MQQPFIADRAALADATDLIQRFGERAALQAAVRAEQSRDADNVLRFCHWRQIERLIGLLAEVEASGTTH